jgi:nitrogen fixation NifU-like protein
MLTQIILSIFILLILAAAAIFLERLKHGGSRKAHGQSSICGTCGDSMEMRLMFEKGRLSQARSRSSGCAFNRICLTAATDLAKGRSAKEILDIEIRQIEDRVGKLPPGHEHCSDLAAQALHAAAKDFLARQGRKGH